MSKADVPVRFGVVGLGRMGANLGRRALELGHEVVALDLDAEAVRRFAGDGGISAYSVADLATKLTSPRIILMYVPHGEPVDEVLENLLPVLEEGDVVADCGNSHWDDARRRHSLLQKRGVHYLDVGTSGGLEGASRGASFMVGGDKDAFGLIEPLLIALAVDPQGVFYAGPPGAGHFVKIVHNGIEFGMVQAIAEGVAQLDAWPGDLDIKGLLAHWNHGSVIRGWLIELAADALSEGIVLDELSNYVEDTGEVKWLLHWSIDRDVPTPVTSAAQTSLMQYRDENFVQAKMHALIRHGFGGHPLRRTSSAGRS